ncbi:MAG: DUF1501 domain-containing protein [Pirellulaceae bacterium]|nr:DUF1501 domain-containing protein [Pirellulaceae bacterium]
MDHLTNNCEGPTRRDCLRIGALGFGTLALADLLRITSYAQGAPRKRTLPDPSLEKKNANDANFGKAKSAIFIDLNGGPSHIDTFDLKPEAKAEYRGEFRPIPTNVGGIEICEHLPKLAACADKFTIIRGVSHTLAAHRLGSQYVNTGNKPTAALQYPGYSSVFAKEKGGAPDLPHSVAIPQSNQSPGFLGIRYAPMNTNSVPQAGRPYQVRGLALTQGLTVEKVNDRNALLQRLDTTFDSLKEDQQLLDGLDEFQQKSLKILTSAKARRAFDVSRETAAFAKGFGTTPFGQSCLLATRLVESGVPFISLSLGGWDTHQNNFTTLKNRLLPTLDEGLSALFTGLHEKGLLETTAVYVTGEFGRTPKVNNRAGGGRDHYPRAMCMLMGGGAVSGGQVIGASDETASNPLERSFSPDDLAATFYYNLGIDPKLEYQTSSGRPITLVRDGNPVHDIFG